MQPLESKFKTWDNAELFYRAWLPPTSPDKPLQKALLLFHRGHEHSARWQQTVEDLKLHDVAIFAWDQRGHGQSPGERGHAENIAAVARDAELFARHVTSLHKIPLQNTVVMAHSVGAVVATAWIHDYAPPIRGLILGTPAFRVKLYVPLAIPALRLKQMLMGKGIVKSYVSSGVLTHDPAQAAAYDKDPAIFKQIAVNVLLDLHDTATRLIDDAGAITVPTLMFAAGNDWVVKLSAQKKFYERLGSSVKKLELLHGFYHAIFHELDRHIVVDKSRQFILECFNRSATRTTLVDADQGGYTRTEYDLLRLPSNLLWKIIKFNMKTGGRLSAGIRLGWQAGFDSGVMLDYIYENQARGTTPLGKFIDRCYLDSIGWRGIRIRKQNMERLLQQTIEETDRQGKPVHILDIAAGAGRYVIETMNKLKSQSQPIPITALLRDYRQHNLDTAKRIASDLGVTNIDFVQGDAFDRPSLATITPRPTIAIVSGLFELFPENEPLRNALGGLADAVDPGGHLIYTCQPWHPQVEFIARVLTNREGHAWIMRRRTQQEMDDLVRAAGFEKIDQAIDPFGIFTVSVARRVS